MYFIDANVIVKTFTNNEDQAQCRKIILSEFVTDTLSLLEAFDAISVIKNDKVTASKFIKSLFKINCTIIDLDKELLFETLKRVDEYNLETFDLIHYTTALINNCSEIVSYDKNFDNLDIKRIKP